MAKQTYSVRVKSGSPPLGVTLAKEVHEKLAILCEAWAESKSGMVARAIMQMQGPGPLDQTLVKARRRILRTHYGEET